MFCIFDSCYYHCIFTTDFCSSRSNKTRKLGKHDDLRTNIDTRLLPFYSIHCWEFKDGLSSISLGKFYHNRTLRKSLSLSLSFLHSLPQLNNFVQPLLLGLWVCTEGLDLKKNCTVPHMLRALKIIVISCSWALCFSFSKGNVNVMAHII